MRHILLVTAALSMAMAAPLLAQGKDNDKGKGNPEASQSKGKKADKQRGGKADKGPGKARQSDKPEVKQRETRREDRRDRNYDRKPAKQAKKYKSGKNERDVREARRDYSDRYRDGRSDVRDTFYVRDDGRFRFDRDRSNTRDRDFYAILGCPPGLAKKGNGCRPPGQARKIRRDRYNYLGYDRRYRDNDYYYSGGYSYRYDSGSNIANSILPLVGGALFGGNVWPQSYDNYRVPEYYQDYYGRNDDYGYRYADRTIFSVNQDDRAIIGIAALLTGDDFEVGRPMPSGYDVYNVPYDYRNRYYDRLEANYRYSDGYVYQVDPETQLIAAIIKLIT